MSPGKKINKKEIEQKKFLPIFMLFKLVSGAGKGYFVSSIAGFALSLFTSDARIEPPIHGLNRLSVGALDISFNLML